MLADWLTTLSLVFGGCCSNAITLEQVTSQYPHAGSLITFFQFLIISLQGLPRHVTWTPYGPRLKPRRISLAPYIIQVALFYFISLLNNVAFAYRIPMAVHIIFRSGGLVVSMVLGWIFAKKKYNTTQVASVILVTLGVVLTTLSASQPSVNSVVDETSSRTYLTGILILSSALVLSGFLGLVQDYTYSKYSRSQSSAPASKTATISKASPPPAWQESMFYLHFLALPMFLTVRKDLAFQLNSITTGPATSYDLPVPPSISATLKPSLMIPPPSSLPFGNPKSSIVSFTNRQSSSLSAEEYIDPNALFLRLQLPSVFLPLVLNTLTQLLCSAGVHRLTTRVSSLTVTLILVVRKALSLVLSIVFGWGSKGNGNNNVDTTMMWTGAALVMLGTVGYSLGTNSANAKKRAKEKKA